MVLAQAQIGLPLQFVRVTVGDGELPTDAVIEDLPDLISPVRDLPINGHTIIGDGTTKIDAVLNNYNLQTGFDLREIGLFAQNQDGETPVLYAYANAGDLPTYIPAGNGPNVVSLIIGLITVIKQAQNIIVNVTDNWGFATIEQLDNRLNGLFGEYTGPAVTIWTAEEAEQKKLLPMPVAELIGPLFSGIEGEGPVLLGYNHTTNELSGHSVNALMLSALTIPVAEWTEGEGPNGLWVTLAISGVTDATNVVVMPGSEEAAEAMAGKFLPWGRVGDGQVTIFANEIPETDIFIKYAIYRNEDASVDTGALSVIGVSGAAYSPPEPPEEDSYLAAAYLGVSCLGDSGYVAVTGVSVSPTSVEINA
jgi:hypothetical protein